MLVFYVYILTNPTNSVFYTGVTSNLIRRIFEHKNKLIPGFTAKYNASKLIYFEQTNSAYEAICREKEVKGWRRRKKIMLIRKENPGMVDLARSWF